MQYHELDLTAPAPLEGQAAPQEPVGGLSAQSCQCQNNGCSQNWLLLVLLLLFLGGGNSSC